MKNFLARVFEKTLRKILAIFLPCVLLLGCLISNPVAAQDDSGTPVSPTSACGLSLCEIDNAINTVNTSINTDYNNMLLMIQSYFVRGLLGVTDPTLNPAPQMDTFDHYSIMNSIDIVGSNASLATTISTISSNLVSYYLAGIAVQQQTAQNLATTTQSAAEDVSGTVSTTTSYSNALNTLTPDTNNAFLDMSALLGPVQYDTPPSDGSAPQKNNAQLLLQYVENLSPIPNVIRVSNKFTIPYTDPNLGTPTMVIDLTQPPASGNAASAPLLIQSLQSMLNSDPSYLQYQANYRSSIIARTLSMNNFLYFYQERLPQTNPDGSLKQSAAAADYQSATWRLSTTPIPPSKTTYMQDIQLATPATLSREQILLLAEMHHDLYKIRQQNEQIIALLSLNNLQVGQMNNMAASQATKQIAKEVYCWYDKYNNGGTNKDSNCTQPNVTNATASPSMVPSPPSG